MSICTYRAEDYIRLPWKNGTGVTDEICLLPEKATRESFEVRVSSAPILTEGRFSSFPGVERTITLIEGTELDLEFDNETTSLEPFQPFTFDTALTPVGKPRSGPVRVVNMMTNRNQWFVEHTRILTCDTQLDAAANSKIFIIALNTSWRVDCAERETTLAPFDSALSDRSVYLSLPHCSDESPRGLAYVLSPNS